MGLKDVKTVVIPSNSAMTAEEIEDVSWKSPQKKSSGGIKHHPGADGSQNRQKSFGRQRLIRGCQGGWIKS